MDAKYLVTQHTTLSVKEISALEMTMVKLFSVEDKSYDYLASISNKSSLKLERSTKNTAIVGDNFDY